MNIADLDRYLIKNWNELFLDVKRPFKIHYLPSFSSYGRHAKINVMVFDNSSNYPFAVCKMPLFENVGFIENEYLTINKLKKIPELKDSFPKTTKLVEIDGKAILIESIILDIPLKQQLPLTDEKILAISKWLTSLHLITKQDLERSNEGLTDHVLKSIQLINNKYVRQDVFLQKYSELIFKCIQSKIGITFPLIVNHNDFTIFNIFENRNGDIRVIDWEFSENLGYPLMDILFFITHLISITENISFRKSLQNIMIGNISSIYKKSIRLYMNKTGLSEELFPLMILLFGLNRWILMNKITFSLQSYDGIEWAGQLDNVLKDIVDLVETGNCKL